jgi:hypothetical protein
MELEQPLLLDRDPGQRRPQPLARLVLGQPLGGRAGQILERRHREIHVLDSRSPAQLHEQLVARDREQVGPEGSSSGP